MLPIDLRKVCTPRAIAEMEAGITHSFYGSGPSDGEIMQCNVRHRLTVNQHLIAERRRKERKTEAEERQGEGYRSSRIRPEQPLENCESILLAQSSSTWGVEGVMGRL